METFLTFIHVGFPPSTGDPEYFPDIDLDTWIVKH